MTGQGTLAVAALAAVVLIGAALFAFRSGDGIVPPPQAGNADVAKDVAAPKPAGPTLYCEFTDVADRNPLVGFSFQIEEGKTPPAYALILRREKDGTHTDLPETAPRPEWRFDGSESPPVIHSPDDSMLINLYEYDPKKPGSRWFEAGRRSVRYRNLGGTCRRSAA